jgi:hypothetical protein
MLDNNLSKIKTLLRSFKSKASASLAVILFGALAIPALAQGTPPAASANCTVTAMNRTAPLQGDYGFTIYNIPGAAALTVFRNQPRDLYLFKKMAQSTIG